MIPRILIVEDDPDMVQLLRIALTDAGYSASAATCGKEALRKAQRSPPDLVILDVLLPGMNGFSVCEELRRNTATAAIPVVMTTVLPGEFPRLVGTEAGADAYLNKPFQIEELLACVDGLLRRTGRMSGPGGVPLELAAGRDAHFLPASAEPALPVITVS
jgi:DNA-binding response OmpR family regulator